MTGTGEQGRGLLLAMMEPPATLEDEFQDWYDGEHFPERAGTEGFRTANRFVCIDGWPRYLALYDLDDVEVMRGPGYAKIAGDNYSRWTHRIVPKVWGHYRAEGTQIHPGRAEFGEKGRAARVAIWRFRQMPATLEEALVGGLRRIYDARPETAQTRVFRSPQPGGHDYIAIVELHAPLTLPAGAVEALGGALKHLDMLNTYVCYNRV